MSEGHTTGLGQSDLLERQEPSRHVALGQVAVVIDTTGQAVLSATHKPVMWHLFGNTSSGQSQSGVVARQNGAERNPLDPEIGALSSAHLTGMALSHVRASTEAVGESVPARTVPTVIIFTPADTSTVKGPPCNSRLTPGN